MVCVEILRLIQAAKTLMTAQYWLLDLFLLSFTSIAQDHRSTRCSLYELLLGTNLFYINARFIA